MPEIPDLEIFSRNVQHALKGKTVLKIAVAKGRRQKTSAAAMNKLYAGSVLQKVYRDGKQLRFKFSNGKVMGVHLMLHGKMILAVKNEKVPHTVASLHFHDGTVLAITDFHHMANIFPDPGESDAPDAMSPGMNAKFLKTAFSNSRKSVKDLMLDQTVVRGLGNAYIDEILWEARVSPFSIASKVPPERVAKIPAITKKILTRSEKEIMKRDPGMIGGRIRDFLLIHNSKNKTSPTGKIIQRSTGSRKTYYTEEQVLYK